MISVKEYVLNHRKAFVAFGILYAMFAFAVLADIVFMWENLWNSNLGGWYYAFKNAAIYALAFSAPALIFGRHSRGWLIFSWLYLFIGVSLAFVLRFGFGMTLNGELLFIIQASSIRECLSFGRTLISFKAILLVFLFIILVFAGIKFIFHLVNWKSSKVGICCGVFFLIIAGIDSRIWSGTRLFTCRIRSLAVWSDIVKDYSAMKKIASVVTNPQLPGEISPRFTSNNSPIGVIVIGESACRSHWSLYGYERKTTPEMDVFSDELVIWRDVITSWPRTTQAVTYILTQAERETPDNFQCSIVDVFRRGGYSVSYITGAATWGTSAGGVSRLFFNADNKIALQDFYTTRFYDDSLFPFFEKEISKFDNNKPVIVFMHLLGSHFAPEDSVPEYWHPFDGKTMCDHYDNSIAFTDALLGKICRKLKELNRPAFMFYLSDHGESPSSSHWRTMEDNDTWEIPMILWMSSQYREAFPEFSQRISATTCIPLQNDQLFWGMVDIAQIDCRGVPAEKNFLSPFFVHKKQRPLQKNDIYYRPCL